MDLTRAFLEFVKILKGILFFRKLYQRFILSPVPVNQESFPV